MHFPSLEQLRLYIIERMMLVLLPNPQHDNIMAPNCQQQILNLASSNHMSKDRILPIEMFKET